MPASSWKKLLEVVNDRTYNQLPNFKSKPPSMRAALKIRTDELPLSETKLTRDFLNLV